MIFIPCTLKVCLIKLQDIVKIILFNEKTLIKSYVNIKQNILHIDSENNIINVNCNRAIEGVRWSNLITNTLFAFQHYFSDKIKFKGKGFRLKIKKQKKICKFLFGHSHITLMYFKNIKLKKCSKYKFTLKGVNLLSIKKVMMLITNIKSNNVYTNRGIRKGRQIIIRRKGKKGSYT